jgi:hypothetical protein
MNNLYEHKARKYKYKYLKLLGEYVGGYERCSQEHLVSLLDNEGKLSPEKHTLYMKECSEENFNPKNYEKSWSVKNKSDFNDSDFNDKLREFEENKKKQFQELANKYDDSDFNDKLREFEENKKKQFQELANKYDDKLMTEEQFRLAVEELNSTKLPQISDFIKESKSGAKVSFQQSGQENQQTGSVIQQGQPMYVQTQSGPAQRQQNFPPQGPPMYVQTQSGPAQRQQNFLPQGQPMIPQGPPMIPQGPPMIPQNLHLGPAQRGNFGLSQGQPMIPQGPPIPPQGYLPENFNPQTGLMNPQLQAQSAPPQTGNFSSYGNFTNYLSQPGVGVGANFGRGYQ